MHIPLTFLLGRSGRLHSEVLYVKSLEQRQQGVHTFKLLFQNRLTYVLASASREAPTLGKRSRDDTAQ